MFQLIVTVISIALIAALAIASIFYGGSAFSGSSAKTAEATLINGGQQISGAAALYRTDNSGIAPTDIDALTADREYLQAIPTPPTGIPGTWEIGGTDGDYAVIEIAAGTEPVTDVDTNNICERVEVDNGASVNDAAAAATVDDITLGDGVPFDCVPVGSSIYFAYKL